MNLPLLAILLLMQLTALAQSQVPNVFEEGTPAPEILNAAYPVRLEQLP